PCYACHKKEQGDIINAPELCSLQPTLFWLPVKTPSANENSEPAFYETTRYKILERSSDHEVHLQASKQEMKPPC
ncbi:hypothetical protein LG954_10915, partial [Bifidobacterium longum subsp. infantis]|uniref:hypothetical protein n=1 Tax=Bifidobacterium longum TaxID=216816 RepID=UPI001CFF6A3F